MHGQILNLFYILCFLSSIITNAMPLKTHEASESGINQDKIFLARMVAHYEYGVKLASLGLSNAQTSEIRRGAEQILKAQTLELKALKKLKRDFVKRKLSTPGPVDHTTDLKKLKGKDFDESFCLRMSMHFEDGKTFIEKALPSISMKRIKTIAANLLKTQSKNLKRFDELEKLTHKN